MPSFADTLAQLDTALGAGALALVPNYRSSDQLIDALSAWRRQQGASAAAAAPEHRGHRSLAERPLARAGAAR